MRALDEAEAPQRLLPDVALRNVAREVDKEDVASTAGMAGWRSTHTPSRHSVNNPKASANRFGAIVWHVASPEIRHGRLSPHRTAYGARLSVAYRSLTDAVRHASSS